MAAIRSLRFLPSTTRTCAVPLPRFFSTSTTAAGAGDPAVHSEEPQGDEAEEAAKAAAAEERQRQLRKENEDVTVSSSTQKATEEIPPFAPSRKFESHEVIPPEPSFQQRRRCSSRKPSPALLDAVTCVGADGTPLRGDGGGNWGDSERQQLEDYEEYYRGHKPSPLSEVEFVDTRKPLTRATDGGASDDVGGDNWRGIMVEDTVDEALARAEAMFREAKERGDPDLPHSRVLLRKLREREQRVYA